MGTTSANCELTNFATTDFESTKENVPDAELPKANNLKKYKSRIKIKFKNGVWVSATMEEMAIVSIQPHTVFRMPVSENHTPLEIKRKPYSPIRIHCNTR